ncbi:hypothetical protein V8F20_005945 [Naviculisporaceae sp. PSN 640]
MDVPVEGGGQTSEGGRFERRKLSDVVLSNGKKPPYVDRNYFIDYAIQSGVNFDKLPQLPFWAGVAGYSDTWRKSVIGADVKYLSSLAGRPLTEEEANRVGEHSANRCRATTHYTPMWTSATAYLWWKGKDKFRFPFYTPKPGLLEGLSKRFLSPIGVKMTHAPLIWHTLRLVAYSQVTSWVIAIFFVAGPTAIFAGGIASDKNLQGLNTELAERAKGLQRQRRMGLPTAPAEDAQSPIKDDAPAPITEQWGQTTTESREQPQQPQQPQGLWRPQQPARARPPPQQPEPEPRYSDENEDDPFDDASPVAPSARRQNLDASTPVGGSAWTRLRTKAFVERTREQANEGFAAPPRTSSWEERRQQNTPGASYTYSEPREAKDQESTAAVRSREQAQKEFDAMLERERRGN